MLRAAVEHLAQPTAGQVRGRNFGVPCCHSPRAPTRLPSPIPATLAPMVVTATRVDAAAFDVPASIDRVGGDALRNARAQVNVSEGLGGVAGLLARDRQNDAQDVQISIRGFGARSSFGIRGVRVFVNGAGCPGRPRCSVSPTEVQWALLRGLGATPCV